MEHWPEMATEIKLKTFNEKDKTFKVLNRK